ncbi:DUF2508 family protein [Cohnella rhizosphaerae]|uniref:YaaL family protein n=1 Tax=Cohnella rhizosphaerae TaxID=1457232 RepID=A0A9X4QSA3_9BACL|nr:DUF2508 family protein [Cohnella rhizosphaerae]MDG0809395.1 YaaL family protein [Cohnella rhizosphaerae]
MLKGRRERIAAQQRMSEREKLVDEVRLAEAEWRQACVRFDDALGADQVDYAIYLLEAAEQKLDMTLRRARMHWHADQAAQLSDFRMESAVVGGEGA